MWSLRGVLEGESVFFVSLCSWRLGQEGIVPYSVGGPLPFFVFLFTRVWAGHGCRATHREAVLATTNWTVEGCRSLDEALVC